MIIDLLNQAGIEYKTRGTNVGKEFVNICCPFCHEARFHCGINMIDYWFKCFVCNEGGSWYKIREALKEHFPSVNWHTINHNNGYLHKDINKTDRVVKKFMGERTKLLTTDICHRWLTTIPKFSALKDSFRPRGIDEEILSTLDIYKGLKADRGYVMFTEGDNVIGRKYNHILEGPKWKKRVSTTPFLYGEEVCTKLKMDMGIITEGLFDMLRLPFGTSIAILGSCLSNAILAKILEIFSNAKKIVLALDRDANVNSVRKFSFALSDFYDVKVVNWNTVRNNKIKDLDELYIVEGKQCVLDFVGARDSQLL